MASYPSLLRLRFVLLSIIVLATSQSAHAVTGECPIEGLNPEAIEQSARDAPSCQRAFELFRLCNSGAGGDVGVGEAVTKRCESEFINTLSKTERQTYRGAQNRCARKYRHETGTMYRSCEAFCGAEVAFSYAKRALRRADRKRP
jgi:hypothetical protein